VPVMNDTRIKEGGNAPTCQTRRGERGLDVVAYLTAIWAFGGALWFCIIMVFIDDALSIWAIFILYAFSTIVHFFGFMMFVSRAVSAKERDPGRVKVYAYNSVLAGFCMLIARLTQIITMITQNDAVLRTCISDRLGSHDFYFSPTPQDQADTVQGCDNWNWIFTNCILFSMELLVIPLCIRRIFHFSQSLEPSSDSKETFPMYEYSKLPTHDKNEPKRID